MNLDQNLLVTTESCLRESWSTHNCVISTGLPRIFVQRTLPQPQRCTRALQIWVPQLFHSPVRHNTPRIFNILNPIPLIAIYCDESISRPLPPCSNPVLGSACHPILSDKNVHRERLNLHNVNWVWTFSAALFEDRRHHIKACINICNSGKTNPNSPVSLLWLSLFYPSPSGSRLMPELRHQHLRISW